MNWFCCCVALHLVSLRRAKATQTCRSNGQLHGTWIPRFIHLDKRLKIRSPWLHSGAHYDKSWIKASACFNRDRRGVTDVQYVCRFLAWMLGPINQTCWPELNFNMVPWQWEGNICHHMLTWNQKDILTHNCLMECYWTVCLQHERSALSGTAAYQSIMLIQPQSHSHSKKLQE